MDDRRRVPIPPRYRGAFDEGVVLSAGPWGQLDILTRESFDRLRAIAESWPDSVDGIAAKVEFFSNIHEDKKDSQGRFTVPENLAEYAGIQSGDRVLVAAAGDHMELWNRDRWRDTQPARRAARDAVMNAAANRAVGGA